MHAGNDITRRHMLGMAGAAGVLLYQPNPPGRGQREDSRHTGADPEDIRTWAFTAYAARNENSVLVLYRCRFEF
jgi:hypothetical protein